MIIIIVAVALRDIQRYQKSISLLIPPTPFRCLVHEMTEDLEKHVKFQLTALNAL